MSRFIKVKELKMCYIYISVDINECVENNVCSQECLNTLGSFKCSCQTGFRLDSSDLKTCIRKFLCMKVNIPAWLMALSKIS